MYSSISTKTVRTENKPKDRSKMSEEKLASHKLDIEGAQRSSADDKGQEPKESYRTISEDIGLSHGECGGLVS